MIIATNLQLYATLPGSNPPPQVNLTAADVNLHLTGSAIVNTSITDAVKTMLLSILANTSVTATAKSKLATYAGFSVNTAVTPNTIVFNSANVSLDKLTFYVIFRLPTLAGLTYQDIDNGIVDATLPAAPTAWGKYANHIRNLTGSGIKKINSAGEQVDTNGHPVDDSGNNLEGWHTEQAYAYLGQNPFSGSYTIPSGAGLYSAATERAMLFGQNTNVPNQPGEQPDDITKIPLYFYLLAKVENPYSNLYWLNPSYTDTRISRIPHWPSNIDERVYRKHFVKKTAGSPNVGIPAATYALLHDANGAYFFVNPGNHKIYIEAIDTASLTFEGISLTTAAHVISNGDGLRAVWDGATTRYFENIEMANSSGLTAGMGMDMGAAFAGMYTITMTISLSGTGTFRLYSGGRRTEALNTTLGCTALKNAIVGLIEEFDAAHVTVKDSDGETDGTPSQIKITRQSSQNEGTTNIAYNHRIYVYDLTGAASVTLSPTNEADRWIENTNAVNDSWFYVNRVFNHAFSNNPPAGDTYYWLNQLTMTQAERDKLKAVLKKCLGCREKSSYYLWDENSALIKKIEFKSYVQNLRAVYHKLFVDRFYNKQHTTANGTMVNNGSGGNSSIKYILEHTDLKTKPNQAELFAMVLLNFNLPVNYRTRREELITAINEHSMPKLIRALRSLSGDRKTAMDNFLTANVKEKLYHGIYD